MKKLLAYIDRFISRIRQPQWFAIISLIFILPFAVVMYYQLAMINGHISFARKEKMGVEHIQAIMKFLQDVQQDRAMSIALLSGDISFKGKIEKKWAEIDDDIRIIDSVDEKYGRILKTTGKWKDLKEKWYKTEAEELNMTPEESFDVHSKLASDIISFILYITRVSNLILDSRLDTDYLMAITTSGIPPITENIGKLRAFGINVITKGAVTEEEKIRLLILEAQIKPTVDMVENNMKNAFQENPDIEPLLKTYFNNAVFTTNTLLNALNSKVINAKTIEITPEEYFNTATSAIDFNFKLYDASSALLKRLLEVRIKGHLREKYYVIASSAFIAVVFFYIFYRFKGSLAEQIRSEEELKNALSLVNTIIETIPLGILMVDSEGKTMKRFNQRFIEMWNIKDYAGEDKSRIGKNNTNIIARPSDDSILMYILSQLKDPEGFLERTRKSYAQPDTEGFDILEFKDGRVFERYSKPHAADEKIAGRVWSYHDITADKKMEEQIKASLKEKEILLKEIHHRVKNNLQIISSLSSLQYEYIKDNQRVVEIFREFQNRIRSMAIVHEKLYKSRDLSRINFSDYIHEMTAHIFNSYRAISFNIKLNINTDDIFLDVDTAIPLGLIINELVSNSIKYGFPHYSSSHLEGEEGRNDEIIIALNSNNGRYTLIVRDNGVGLPEGLDFKNAKTLGLQLVNTLTEQVQGTIEVDRKNGTEFRITFQ